MSLFRIFRLLVLVLVPAPALVALIAAAPVYAEKRVALVIGNGAYQHAPALANPRNDAENVAAALKRLGFDVSLGVDLDKSSTDRLLEGFERKLDGAEVALFFYAGHGLQVNGRNFLVPVDAKLEREAQLNFQAVALDLVQTLMEQTPRTNIIILDACRDNPLARSLARGMGTRSTAIGNGLAQVQGGRGTLIVYATQPGNVALDGQGRNSPFTAALLEHIETPGLEVRQVLTRVRASVTKATGDKQLPWEATSLIGDFYFAPKTAPETKPGETKPPAPAGVTPPTSPGQSVDHETVFWQSISDSKNAADFKDYLARWPQGTFADLAKRRIAEIEKAGDVRPPPAPKSAPEKPQVTETAAPSKQQRTSTFEVGIFVYGEEALSWSVSVSAARLCQQQCIQNARCGAWRYHSDVGGCALFARFQKREKSGSGKETSGVIRTVPAAAPAQPQAPKPPAAEPAKRPAAPLSGDALVREMMRKAQAREKENGFCGTTNWPDLEDVRRRLGDESKWRVGSQHAYTRGGTSCAVDRILRKGACDKGGDCFLIQWWGCMAGGACSISDQCYFRESDGMHDGVGCRF